MWQKTSLQPLWQSKAATRQRNPKCRREVVAAMVHEGGFHTSGICLNSQGIPLCLFVRCTPDLPMRCPRRPVLEGPRWVGAAGRGARAVAGAETTTSLAPTCPRPVCRVRSPGLLQGAAAFALRTCPRSNRVGVDCDTTTTEGGGMQSPSKPRCATDAAINAIGASSATACRLPSLHHPEPTRGTQ